MFEWNVDREILSLGFFQIRWYSLLFAVGFIAGYFYLKKILEAEKKPIGLLDSVLTYAILGTILGARLGHCLLYEPEVYLSEPLRILKVWEGGLASHGGFTGLIIGLFLVSRKYGLAPMWLIDRCCPSGMLAAGFIRLGNFFNSEIVGRPTDGTWGVIFKQLKEDFPRHPTQLYEAAGYMIIGLILHLVYRMQRERTPTARLFGLALILGFSYRFGIEFFKENQVSFEDTLPVNMGQLLSLPFVALGFFLSTAAYRNSAVGKALAKEEPAH